MSMVCIGSEGECFCAHGPRSNPNVPVSRNPVHPSLFATASSNGNMGLWNLASSLDEPVGDVVVDQPNGLNRLKWSLDGRRVLVAGGDKMYVMSLAEEVLRRKGDESDRMMEQLAGRGLVTKI